MREREFLHLIEIARSIRKDASLLFLELLSKSILAQECAFVKRKLNRFGKYY